MIRKSNERLNALEGKSLAQALAFGPFAFQAAVSMRDLGLLQALDEAGPEGLSLEALSERTGLSRYGVSVLVDLGLNLGLTDKEGDRFTLGMVGHFVENDEMTRVNMDFTRDVCYQALAHLTESIREGRPAGLKTLGEWNTVYEGLTQLPQPAQDSWFHFDHFYSQNVFDKLLPRVFDRPVQHLLDVGGNTGRFALKCLNHDPEVRVTLMDLPAQLKRARENIAAEGLVERVEFLPANLLDESVAFPPGMDVIWMSQFLDCFSDSEIVSILERAARSMTPESRLLIVELFPDRQAFDAATFSLDATSLYFTCIANGNSRMYHYEQFADLIRQAGLVVEENIDHPAEGHTLLCCRIA